MTYDAHKLAHGRQYLAAIKAKAAAGKPSLVLHIGDPPEAILRPIPTAPGCLDKKDVRLLSEWRNRFVKAFLTEFLAHDERTASWLSGFVHENEGKILFMVEDMAGNCIGHVGLGLIDWNTGYGEADAIVRGADAPRGLMKKALQTLLAWGKDQLGLVTLGVRVRSDNTALEFYKKVGFEEAKRVPLSVSEKPGFTAWIEDPANRHSKVSLVYMLYKPAMERKCHESA